MFVAKYIKYIKITVLTVAGIILSAGECLPQRRTSTLQFDSESWDFGKIREQDGLVSHVFTFTNTGSSAVLLETVNSDCGCTVPRYDRKPIKPKEKGIIEVTFDPNNQSGIVRKYITVMSDRGRNRNMLSITADVIPRPRSLEETYPLAIGGGLRGRDLYISFDKLQNNSRRTDSVVLANTSGKAIRLEIREIIGSGFLSAQVPSSIGPGETGVAVLTYELDAAEPVYGPLHDKVFLNVNGVEAALPLSTYATAVDDFSKIDPRMVPRCVISPVFHNFGPQKPGASPSKEIEISNTGDAPLIVRNINPRSNTVCSLEEGTTIAPGSSIKVKVTMRISRDAYGVVGGGVTLVLNDPDRPVREIRLASEIK